jgi:hypothetical protein
MDADTDHSEPSSGTKGSRNEDKRDRLGGVSRCIHCKASINSALSADETVDRSGTTDDPRAPGTDSIYICEVCQRLGLVGTPGTQGKYGRAYQRITSLDEIDWDNPEVRRHILGPTNSSFVPYARTRLHRSILRLAPFPGPSIPTNRSGPVTSRRIVAPSIAAWTSLVSVGRAALSAHTSSSTRVRLS